MTFAHLAVSCLIPLALWILISGLDDLFIDVFFLLFSRRRFPWPSDAQVEKARERRIAILVPLWREHRVIGQMLEHNLTAIRYSAYDIFVGVYPNDDRTARVVAEADGQYARVHMVIGPHDGPTSKGDCLNWVYAAMKKYESRHRIHFDILMTHDAEDLVEPESLRLVNWYSREYGMVQVPVLPLPTPALALTHGLYCDEFAEFQTKDIPVRQRMGAFLPASGVGTGFRRDAIEHLARTRGGMIFNPASLTEDYENGYGLHRLGYRQIFLPVGFRGGRPVATREYFPRGYRAAVRQRSRWVAGIALQGWQSHGWNGAWKDVYWLWRDRKGLVGSLMSPFANLVFLAAVGDALLRQATGKAWLPTGWLPGWLSAICLINGCMSLLQQVIRCVCSARIYGWRFAAGVPLRLAWGNVINCGATLAAVRQFVEARRQRRAMEWRKTEHVYPAPRLGELLVRLGLLPIGEVESAALSIPKGLRLGEYLVRLQKLSEKNLYEALSLQAGIPSGSVCYADVDRLATRALPAAASRRWRVLPYRIETGKLHVAVDDLPSAELKRSLRGLSPLEIRFHLVRPNEFEMLFEDYLQ